MKRPQASPSLGALGPYRLDEVVRSKYRTVIEDDVFIGSDTQLVAPVRVGRGATLGAWTTLTKDAPAEQLAMSRAKQLSIAGWKKPVKNK